ncbi:hypothetical protein EI77_02227 [Prosthecobacter fusiformis]|uniref:Uncharacterized protein n=1 Tax=Prosthecobacter fusiformis TaxID=48464 RepID=A0A4R7S0C4_9BACT|nr:hypothetical protein [Prosthecobacter fusiformis]TDU71109.1 hypothetical protein EI77_02227 [Prosthecobacter fusiformis]
MSFIVKRKTQFLENLLSERSLEHQATLGKKKLYVANAIFFGSSFVALFLTKITDGTFARFCNLNVIKA